MGQNLSIIQALGVELVDPSFRVSYLRKAYILRSISGKILISGINH